MVEIKVATLSRFQKIALAARIQILGANDDAAWCSRSSFIASSRRRETAGS